MEKAKRTTSPVIFQLDTKLKQRAMKKAHNEGLPFASVMKYAARAFVDGNLEVGLLPERFNESTRKRIQSALKDAKQGKNLSPKFKSAKEAMKYLDSMK
ncbi:MAG: hypothetical protein Q7S47_02270 [bacterium]|nr:hypothetical protein [bacterium]